MKTLLSWLQEFAPFPDDPDLIGDTFTRLGTPVEDVTYLGDEYDGIVVARVEALREHPNADKVQLVDVDAGDGPIQIVCGAFNMAVGDLVPLATVGTTMPGGMEIARRKLRGELSNGMLCSSRELGLSDDHSGIRILDVSSEPGTPLADALGIVRDVLWDLEINPNRPDAMCVAGLARDAAAALDLPFTLPDPKVTPTGAPAAEALTIEIADPDLCGRFGAWVLRNVSIGSSPSWMQRRLLALGMRPINALVDISNYVMLELGQPNHPYDLALVPGRGLVVRRARPGEQLETLDGVVRTFTGDDLLICDAEQHPVGIAGVMGGASCEISATTTDVLLEMAWFQPWAVSRTSRRLGLRTEASARFEKGCDPEVIPLAAARFCALAADICGATTAPGAVIVDGDLPARPPVRTRTARVNALLGTDLSADQIRAELEPIGYACTPVPSENGVVGEDQDVTVPSWRYDCEVEIDIVEEVARHWGYDRIERRGLTKERSGRLTTTQKTRREVRRLLKSQGLAEVMPLPFLAPGDLERCGLEPVGIELRNPMVAEESILRTSLRPGLLAATALNESRRSTGVSFFEIGHVFLPAPEGQLLPDEREHVAVLLAGREAPAAVEAWLLLADLLRVEQPAVVNEVLPGLHPGRSATATVAGSAVGVVGEIDPDVLDAFGIGARVAWFELDLGALFAGPRRPEEARPVSRYPSSDIDLAFDAPDEVSAIDLERTLAGTDPLVWSVELFDTFRGDQIGDGRRSLAYRVRLQAADRTLTDEEVAGARSALVAAAESRHGVDLRG
jgi:phenylalanyl-tRNA synthetase beta chain